MSERTLTTQQVEDGFPHEPEYEAAEAVLLAGADTQKLMGTLAKLGAQTNPYRLNEGSKNDDTGD